MSEWINKEALLEQIRADSYESPGKYGDEWEFMDTINNMPVRSDLISRCDIRDVPSADRPKDDWIPCSERMPEKSGKYLCCWQGTSVETGMFLNGHFRLYGEIKDKLVTAWMSVPEPWKGADNESVDSN